MTTLFRLAISFILVICIVNTANAQDNSQANDQRDALTVTAFALTERVRFTAPSTVVQIRLEVYNSAGRKMFDNELRGGSVIDWHLQDGQADRLAADTYLCVVTVKSLSGRITQRIGLSKVENNSAIMQPMDGSQMTAQQSQAIGPIEENASLTVLNDDENRTTTITAHNGEEGQITRGKGALSFRLGDFYSGRDVEQMRLTAEGNLGIGITHPQARLDVDGLIRTTQGIVFPDGSIQYSAATKTYGAKSSLPDPSFQSLQSKSGKKSSGGQEHIEAMISSNMIAKFENDQGTLTNSSIFDNGSIGIGTSTPDSLINIQGALPSLLGHMAVIRTTGSNNGFGLFMDATGAGNNNLGMSVNGSPKATFARDNARNFIGYANLVYSVNDFAFRLNSDGSLTYHDGATSAERFRITKDGNVGIGASAPAAKLHIKGSEEGIRVQGPATESANVAYLSFFDSNGARIGYVGDGSIHEKNVYLTSDSADVALNTAAGRILTATSTGNVGIGTTNPTLGKLHVEGGSGVGVFGVSNIEAGVQGNSTSSTGVRGISTSSTGVGGVSGSGYGVRGISDSGIGLGARSNTGPLIAAFNLSTPVSRFFVANDGTVHAPAYEGLPDFAEEILPSPADKSRLEPGDVLVAASDTDRSVSRSRKPYSTSVLGVYSTAPGFIGTENPLEGASSETIPMAVIGIVPCKVSAENGPIKRGDLLTTSRTPGHAMRCTNHRKCFGAIVGKALAKLDRGTGVIKVLVGSQ